MKQLLSQKFLARVIAAVLCLTVVTGCSSNTANDSTGEVSESTTKDELVIALDQEIVSTDPADQAQRATSQFMIQMYETLLCFDKDGEIQPLLAETVTQIDDLTYEVKLRGASSSTTARR